jgi:hypothetical protein
VIRHLVIAAALALAALAARGDGHGHGEDEERGGRKGHHEREHHDRGDGHGGPLMRPGEDCLACHGGSGEARRFSAAGTVFRERGGAAAGVRIGVTIGGRTLATTTNSAGNFWFTQAGAVSAAEVAGIGPMPEGAGIEGSCNACHAGDTRLVVP